MKDKRDDSAKILLGVVIGGVVGGSLLFIWHAAHKKSVLDQIGKAISDVGEILESSVVTNRADAAEEIEKAIPKGEVVNNVITLLATGIQIWKKVKKGL